jgi:hypothetical protein
VPWVGQYELGVGDGSQTGSWSEHHQSAGTCDASETGSGTQDATLSKDDSAPVFASGIGPTLTTLAIAAPTQGPEPTVKARVGILRHGTLDQGTGGCASGGGDNGTPTPKPDCGAKTEFLNLTVDQHGHLLGIDQSDSELPDDPYDDCPYLGPGVYPSWIPMTIVLPAFGWGPPPPIGTAVGSGQVDASGSATTDEHDADTDASANERLTLRFMPVSVIPTVVLGDVAAEATGAGVTVGCPTREKSGCTGSVALAIDVNEPRSFPAQAHTTSSLASVRFTLRAGKHQRLHLRIPHASKLVLKSISQAPTVLVVTIGRKHRFRYEGARVRLHG